MMIATQARASHSLLDDILAPKRDFVPLRLSRDQYLDLLAALIPKANHSAFDTWGDQSEED
jgi:hypothetical protein